LAQGNLSTNGGQNSSHNIEQEKLASDKKSAFLYAARKKDKCTLSKVNREPDTTDLVICNLSSLLKKLPTKYYTAYLIHECNGSCCDHPVNKGPENKQG
jgi:hypothetical protein